MLDTAKLKNTRWAYSSITEDAVVVSCWSGYLPSKMVPPIRYEVNDFSKWTSNPLGKKLLKEHLTQALQEGLLVRMVLAEEEKPAAAVAGVDGSKIRKRISVREDLIGRVLTITDKRFSVLFENDPQNTRK